MKKIKFFASIYKERDWLEEMAAQGWLFTDATLGFLYHFHKIEPCQKVFEIERFDTSLRATIQELNARNHALDLAAESGWTVVTHDEDMNYYFIKDKADNDTDEFYSAEADRKERAERFRMRHTHDAPIGLLVEWLIISVFCMLILFMMLPILNEIEPAIPVIFGLIYIITTITEIGSAFYNITLGQYLYEELSLSRKEWEYKKQFNIRKQFRKVGQLSAFLSEQLDSGLALKGYENNFYRFEHDSCRYDYFIDTKASVKKRSRKQNRNLNSSGLKWYEISITDATEYGLQPLGVIRKNAIIYRRPHSDKPLPSGNENQALHRRMPSLLGATLTAGALIVGLFLGILAVRLGL